MPDIETALDSDDDIDSEDDIDNGVKSVLDAVKGVNLTPSSRYDFQSILKSLTIDELPKINIFLEILKEMKERYLCIGNENNLKTMYIKLSSYTLYIIAHKKNEIKKIENKLNYSKWANSMF